MRISGNGYFYWESLFVFPFCQISFGFCKVKVLDLEKAVAPRPRTVERLPNYRKPFLAIHTLQQSDSDVITNPQPFLVSVGTDSIFCPTVLSSSSLRAPTQWHQQNCAKSRSPIACLPEPDVFSVPHPPGSISVAQHSIVNGGSMVR